MPQDITPPKKSIRQVTLKREPDDVRDIKIPGAGSGTRSPVPFYEPAPPQRTSRRGLWLIAALSVVFLYLTFAVFLAGATVVVTARQASVALDGRFSTEKNNDSALLSYEIMTLESEEKTALEPTGETRVEEKASGQILVYNNFGAASQRLIKNTRFESSDGLVYRIAKSIEVPGQKTVEGKITPGMLEVTVYADNAGEKYNIALTNFTIPGLKGDSRFEQLYAKSKTPMAGGRIGMVKTVSAQAEATAREALRSVLAERIRTDARAQVPEGFVLYDDAVFITHTSPAVSEEDGKVVITEKAMFSGVLFHQALLARAIATQAIPGFDGGDVIIPGVEALSFSLLNRAQADVASDARLEFTLRGNVDVLWQFDENQLRQDLAGKPKRMINTVLSGYPGIEKAEVTIRPFWKSTFPQKEKKISIEIVPGKVGVAENP